MTVWFTADQHFGHGRLLELSAARGAAGYLAALEQDHLATGPGGGQGTGDADDASADDDDTHRRRQGAAIHTVVNSR